MEYVVMWDVLWNEKFSHGELETLDTMEEALMLEKLLKNGTIKVDGVYDSSANSKGEIKRTNTNIRIYEKVK